MRSFCLLNKVQVSFVYDRNVCSDRLARGGAVCQETRMRLSCYRPATHRAHLLLQFTGQFKEERIKRCTSKQTSVLWV